MNKTKLDTIATSARIVASQQNPLQKHIEFVFTDFSPNKNKQGVTHAEADNIIRTGLNQPVKVDFRRGKVGDHPFSVPVGPITDMNLADDRIIARAIIWKDEFGDLSDFLEKASASDDGVHFSWELYYDGKNIDDDGNTWLNNVVVAGATIVAKPAYDGRTPLLAIASEDSDRIDELERQVAALTEQLSQNGSNQSMDPMEELKQLITGLGDRLAKLEEASQPVEPVVQQASEDTEDIAALKDELETLRAFKADAEKKQARAAVLDARRVIVKDVFTADEFAAKADFIADLSDDQFKVFSDTLMAASQKAKSSASYRGVMIPDPVISAGNGGISTLELAKALREHK